MNVRKGFSTRRQDLDPVTYLEGKPEPEDPRTQQGMFKPVLILTTLLFLLVAPAPDSRDILEMSSNFLVLGNHSGLLASAEPVLSK